MPDISLIMVSHDKPRYAREALQSVLGQTCRDWEAVLVDCGVLLRHGYFNDFADPRVRVICSGETPGMGATRNMASWCFNRVLNRGLLRGELIMYLCDDDLLYPEAFETFWRYYLEQQREPQAMYASQDIGIVGRDGNARIVGKRAAVRPAGRFCHGKRLDCRVDYLQFCHSAAILKAFAVAYGTTQYHSEDLRDAKHADGIFMERVGALTMVHSIDKVLSLNRKTPQSVNGPSPQGVRASIGALFHSGLSNIRARWLW